MEFYDSIGSMIKWFIDCRNRTIKETAAAMNIKYTTFSAQLNSNTVTAETLMKLASYLDIDLNWMLVVLGYHGSVSAVEREMIPRMQYEFRNFEKKKVEKVLDQIIIENPDSTPDARRELLRVFGNKMFYLLDVLVPEEYNLYMISERGKNKYYVDIPRDSRGCMNSCAMRRKAVSVLFERSKALDIVIEERKEQI